MVLVALTVGSVAVAAENPASGTATRRRPLSGAGFIWADISAMRRRSDWTATGAAGPPVRDSLNLFKGY